VGERSRLERRELAHDARVGETGFLLELAQQRCLEVFARLEPARGDLRAGARVVSMVEDEQLAATVALACHIREHAVGVGHASARSFAL
jgi:hypothetical protein